MTNGIAWPSGEDGSLKISVKISRKTDLVRSQGKAGKFIGETGAISL